ncbi:RagB/SusD family nutrient uptake outer membrane protein [Pedobacter sp. SD-b]|uniref:RagB/SusD family nutrient uptake outer membrane protein n=1 Tax=Pedobacter segetis TaxID=2793069 RepID=A0ABS1BGL5_9SPHI|nr:RagB/SusD family nutrient uptake outer membrane protein [Pedobacter segetis]MBK0381936.1 RagB/SusD family nutrient uptake outer membrane protein [Pedobacter segetis]
MKKFIKFLIIPAIWLASCEKSLDIVPESFVSTENFFNTQAEIEVALNAIYEVQFSGSPYQAGYNEYWRHCFLGTDESTSNQNLNTNDYPTHYNETSSSIKYVQGLWSTCFVGVNRANVFLENIDKSKSITEDQRTIYRGEATFLRAYYLFMLTQWFGDIPLPKESSKSLKGVQRAFTPTKEVYDFVISEMEKAQDLLKLRPATALTFNEKVSQTAVQGMLARVCLFAAGYPVNDTKRYADASMWAQKVIASGLHHLNPDYDQVFIDHSSNIYDNTNRETLWQLTPISNANLQALGTTLREQYIPRVGLTASRGIWGADQGFERTNPRAYYTYAAGDIRRDWNIAPFYISNASSIKPTDINPMIYFPYNASKWNREPGKWRRYYETHTTFSGPISAQAFPLLRYSDVLLMYAEAEAHENGPLSPGTIGMTPVDAVNLVRRRGYGEARGAKGVATITLTSPGSGYTTQPECTFVSTPGNRKLRTQTVPVNQRPYLNEDARATGIVTSGAISGIELYDMGEGYVIPPTVIVGTPFAPNTVYTAGKQVVNNGNLYTVTVAGTSGNVAPTNASGTFVSGTTTFTYAGVAATAVANFASADLTPAMASAGNFLKTIQDERLRELAFECLRRQDLKRWGILVSTVKRIGIEAGAGSEELNSNGTKLYGAYAAPSTALGNLNANVNIFTTGPNNITEIDNLLPIPNSEIIANKLAKQNPGY